jgi:putative flippase GtrA
MKLVERVPAPMRTDLLRQVLFFGLVGGSAFFVDAGVLLVMTAGAGWGAVEARLVSFLCAASFTWALNRRLTFRVERRATAGEYAAYTAAMGLGAGVNWAVFLTCLAVVPVTTAYPVLALVPATAAAMVVNFVMSRAILMRPGARAD